MPEVLLLHAPNPLFETRRLVGLLAERVRGVERVALHPHYVLPTFNRLSRAGAVVPVVHAFGGRALGLAVVSAKGPVVYTPTRFPRASDVAWMRAILRYRTLRIVCQSDAEQRAWVTGGVPVDRCVLIRPGVPLAKSVDTRATVRARLGYRDTDRVVFTPLPAAGQGRADPVWTGCLLNLLDSNIKAVAWAEQGTDALHALRTRLIAPDAMTVLEDASPELGFLVADAILLPTSDFIPPTLIAMAMASGRPIVARTTAQACEMIEDRHTALLTKGRSPKVLAERVVDLFADAELGRRIADRARAEVYDYFLPSRMVGDYRTLYANANAAAPADRVTARPAAV